MEKKQKKQRETGSVDNLLSVLHMADSFDRRQGMNAYLEYRDEIRDIWKEYNEPCSFNNAVAAFAALSPNNDEDGNFRDLQKVIAAVRAGIDVNQFKTSTYTANKLKAWNLVKWNSFVPKELRGLKVTNFYHNILDPCDRNYVTVDGHMKSMWIGRRVKLKHKDANVTVTEYRAISKALMELAAKERMMPHQLQATLWYTWKRVHNIRFDPQLRLFV